MQHADAMAQADFYVLDKADDHSRYLTVCRLVEKAFRQGHRIHIHTGTAEQAQELDEWLWSFRPDSFIPHSLQEAPEATDAPVTLGCGSLMRELDSGSEPTPLLINLALEIPDFFSRFQRIAEVVVQKPDILSATRDHFRFYRDRGYNTATYNLK